MKPSSFYQTPKNIVKSIKGLTFITLCTVILFSACKKDRPIAQEQTLTLADFNSKFNVPAQNFNGTAGAAFSITGTKGVKADFPANAFLDAAGNIVTGNVRVVLKEVLSKKDIMLSGKMTESNGQILISGGEIQIIALQNGQALKLNPAVNVAVKVPTTLSTQPMDLFQFAPAVSDSTWVLNQKARVNTSPTYYEFTLPGFGWVNCDYFYSNPNPKTTITASPTYTGAVPSIKDQRVYMIFDNINSVIGLPFVVAINKHQSYINSMPIGLSGKMAIIAVGMDDRIYFGHTSFTISSGLHLNIPLAVSTQSDIDNFLNSL